MLQAFLDSHRATLLFKCAGLTGEQMAGRTVPPSGLSLLGLVRHMTKVERAWFRQRFAGEPVDDPFGGDKTADFERGRPGPGRRRLCPANRGIQARRRGRGQRFPGRHLHPRRRAHVAAADLPAHDRGVRAAPGPRRPPPRADRRRHRRVTAPVSTPRRPADGLRGRPIRYRRGVTGRRPRAFRCRPRAGAAARARRKPPGHGRSSPPSGPPRISPRPAPLTMPATRAKVAMAKSMFGSGRDFCLTSASTASATASWPDFGAARRTKSSSTTARGSPPRYTKCPKPGTLSPRRSSSATTRGTSSGPLAAAISVSTPSDAPPCSAPLIAPRPVPTTAYGSARTEAAARAASVEAASS